MTTATDMSGRSVAYTLIEPLVNDPPTVDATVVIVVFENDDLIPTVDEPYIECHWRPGPKRSAMDGSTLHEAGTMRFEINTPTPGGATYINALADEIESHYPPACRLPPRGGWTVTVMEVGRSAAQRLKNWRRCYVDVGYIAVKA